MKLVFRKIENLVKKICAISGVDIRRIRSVGDQIASTFENRSIDIVIDVGTNKGQFISELVNVTSNTHYYCFEPLPDCFEELSEKARKAKTKMTCFNYAVGETVSTINMNQHVDHSPSSSILGATNYSKEKYRFTNNVSETSVSVVTLDSLLDNSELKLEKENILLKLDVQGYEDRVLKGAMQTLKKVNVVVLEVCVAPLYETQAMFGELVALLSDAGFCYKGNIFQSYDADNKIIYLDALFAKT